MDEGNTFSKRTQLRREQVETMQGTNDNTSIFVLLRTVYSLPVVVRLFVSPFPTAHPIGLASCQLAAAQQRLEDERKRLNLNSILQWSFRAPRSLPQMQKTNH